MKVKDITTVLEQWAPLRIQESWDNSGLIVGHPDDEVHGVIFGFDCTLPLIEEAARRGCDMVVTHHPLIFKGIRQVRRGDPVSDTLTAAIRQGIAVYAAHTTADKVLAGVSGAMARRLGLQGITFLSDEGGYGLGAVGDLPSAISGEQALEKVASCFPLRVIRHSAPATRISRVALLGGSGASEASLAWQAGAQLYISSDISYHHFFLPPDRMVMDIGHFESEVEIVQILFSLIRKNFPNFASCISECTSGSNPVLYYVK